MANAKFYGTGRRKIYRQSILYRVQVTLQSIREDIDNYFGLETLKVVVRQPLVAAKKTADKFDVLVTVRGGGFTGQAGAIIAFQELFFRLTLITDQFLRKRVI